MTKNVKVLSGPKPWDELTVNERKALIKKYADAKKTNKKKKES